MVKKKTASISRKTALQELATSRRQPIVTRPQENFHQQALHDMFGGGDKIWGWNNQPVEINETITSGEGLIKGTSRLSDQDPERRVASMFGI